MAYSDDAVRAKLSALNETQDSIVTVAQWIMFHRRHADRTAQLWLERLRESNTAKRLNLVYLANEVVQQSKARRKDDFLRAYEPIVAEATASAYKNSPMDIQQKLRRVVEVWRQRMIFNPQVQDAIENRLNEIDRGRSAKTNGARLGGSLFGGGPAGGAPPELQALAQHQTALSKSEASTRPLVTTANTEFAKLTDPSTPLPTPPVHAARLSSLLRNLASAQGAVEQSITTRKSLIVEMEKLLETNRRALEEEEMTVNDFVGKREGIETRKKEVEDGIMRGLSTSPSPATTPAPANSQDPAPPERESFTPPPPDVEAFTPTGTPGKDDYEPPQTDVAPAYTSNTGADLIEEQPVQHNEPPPAFEPPPAIQQPQPDPASAANSFLEALALPQVRPVTSTPPNGAPGDPRLKRRKMSHKTEMDDEMFGSGSAMVDEGLVEGMLGGT